MYILQALATTSRIAGPLVLIEKGKYREKGPAKFTVEEALAAVGKMQSDGRSGPIGKRIHEDPSGVYKRVKKVSRQQ